MIRLKEEETPILPGTLMIDDKCYSLGITKDGVIIQYYPNDDDSIAYLIEWKDIIGIGEKEITAFNQPIQISKPLFGHKGKRV